MGAIHALRLLERKTRAEVFLVGGFVRDYLRKKRNTDIDVVVRNITLEEAYAFLKAYGKCKIVFLQQTRGGQSITVLLFQPFDERESIVQITLPKRGKSQIAEPTNSLRHDAKYRDFKFNALYLPIFFSSKSDIIDFTGGLQDISNRRITPITNAKDCFEVSPVRMLRMVRFAANTNYRIAKELLREARKQAEKILTVPTEVIREEFNKILLSPKPSRYIRLLHKIGILKYILPELDRCVRVYQDSRYHRYDVFTHSILTVDFLEPDLVLRLAGLLHDIGKVDTRAETKDENGEIHVTFHKHELVSVRLAKTFLKRLRYDNKTREKVLSLIRMHMYHYTRDYTDAAVRRFIKNIGITEKDLDNLSNLPLFKLRAAERQGNGLKREPITQRQIDFEDRIRKLFLQGSVLEIKDLCIDGNIIMNACDLRPGPIIGKILSYLRDRVSEKPELNNRLDLLSLAVSFLKDQEHLKNENHSFVKEEEKEFDKSASCSLLST